MNKKYLIPLIIAILIALSLFIIFQTQRQKVSKIVRIYDGDTFELESGEKVRLLCLNAPELSEYGGDISKDFLEKLVLEKEVRLERDVTNKDVYGRLLRYVYVGNCFINGELIRKGYAETRCYPPDTLYKKDLEALEEIACKNKKGLWAFSVFQIPSQVSTLEKKRVKEKTETGFEIPSEQEIISWKHAGKYYGRIKTVEGTVVATYSTGKVCFLNFHQDYKRHFTAVIFAGDFHKFPSCPEDYYLYKKVQVTGLIKKYKGKPEIILKSPSQIEIIK